MTPLCAMRFVQFLNAIRTMIQLLDLIAQDIAIAPSWESVLTLLCRKVDTTMLKSYALKRNSTFLTAVKHSPICWQSHSFVSLLANCVSSNRQKPKALVHTQGFWHLYQDELKQFGKSVILSALSNPLLPTWENLTNLPCFSPSTIYLTAYLSAKFAEYCQKSKLSNFFISSWGVVVS